MDTSDNLDLPYIMPSQAQKHVTHNEALGILDALVQLAVLDRDLAAPPGSVAEGARYIVAGTATGPWAGQEGKIAHRLDGTWSFYTPKPGWLAFIVDETKLVCWTGSAWVDYSAAITALQNLTLLGIGTTADAANPFAAKLNKALWTAKTVAEGGDGDLRYTMNKETAPDVLSLLLQTGWSGRAELGLIGGDDFCLKVSPDGSAWTTALAIDRTTGQLLTVSGSAAAPGLAVGAAGTGWRRDASNHCLSACVDGVDQGGFSRGGKLFLRKRMLMKPNIPQRNHVANAAWVASASAADNSWRSLCWSPELGRFCAVAITGTGNRVMTSPDGIAWTARPSAADRQWRSVAWAPEPGLFCAVADSGAGGRVMTSPDGVAWTLRSSAADNNWQSVAWAPELGLFCAVSDSGTGNRVMTSPDGVAWTLRSSAADNSWQSVAWAPELGLFCAVAATGSGNRVMTSPDGAAWTLRSSPADNNWWSVAWAPELGLFCAVAVSGTGNRVMTSPDGTAWTLRSSPADNYWWSVAWAPELGLFCAVAATGSGNRVMTSPDGVAWTLRSSAADNNWRSLAWAPELGLYCAISDSGTGNRASTSKSAFTYPYRS